MPGFTSWQDFDLKRRILTLARSIVGKYVWNGGKTGASEDEVALDSKLGSVLEDWQKRCVPTPEGWLFANADTKRPVHGDVTQKDYLRPAGETVGLLGVGWHTFRKGEGSFPAEFEARNRRDPVILGLGTTPVVPKIC